MILFGVVNKIYKMKLTSTQLLPWTTSIFRLVVKTHNEYPRRWNMFEIIVELVVTQHREIPLDLYEINF